jgi:glucose-1-phosphate adenylyltransferase
MGIYVFRVRALVDALQRFSAHDSGFDFGYQIVPSLIETGRVYAYDFCDEGSGAPRYWRDVGGIDSYYAATMDFLGSTPPFHPLRIGAAPSFIAGGKGRISRTVFCGDVRISDNVEIEDSILLPGVRVGSDVRLRRAIVDEGFTVPDGFEAGWETNASRKVPSVVVLSEARPAPADEHEPGTSWLCSVRDTETASEVHRVE